MVEAEEIRPSAQRFSKAGSVAWHIPMSSACRMTTVIASKAKFL